MRIPMYGRILMTLGALGAAGLLLLACSTQVPLNTTVAAPVEVTETVAAATEPAEALPAPAEKADAVPAAAVAPADSAAVEQPAVVSAAPVEPAAAEPAGTGDGAAVEAVADTPPEGAKGSAQLGNATPTGLSVSGRGQASAAPDLATLNLGVEAFAANVSDARAEGAEVMADVIQTLQDNGVAEKDIQTSHFNIYPRYTSRQVTRCVTADSGDGDKAKGGVSSSSEGPAGGQEGGKGIEGITSMLQEQECYEEWESVIIGYQVSNSVTVLVRDLDSVGSVIDAVAEAGENLIRFNGIGFTLEDTYELQKQARAAAVADLKDRAGQLAELSGVTLGRLTYLAETSYAPPARADTFLAKEAAVLNAAAATTPIATGEVSVEVSVQGRFAIQ